MKKHPESGLSVIELIISISILAFASLWIVDWLRKPSAIQRMIMSSDQQRQLSSGTGILLNDLAEADPASIVWSVLPPISTTSVSGISFWKPKYDMANPGTVGRINFQYTFQANGASGTGALVRVSDAGTVTASTSVVLSPIDRPGVGIPSLIQADKADPADTTYSILIVTLQYHPNGSPPARMVRRLALAM